MQTIRIRLDQIAFDAGTQIRAAINEGVVAEYAAAMADGATFPAVVLFHDGSRYFLADGFHRYMAARRNQAEEIEATVQAGTREDALWYALGANKANGQRLTDHDKRHAVAMALAQWPQKMQREIAEQVGCHPSWVSHVAANMSSSEPVLRGRALSTAQKKEAVRLLVSAGDLDVGEIARRAKVSRSLITEVRMELGLSTIDKSAKAVRERLDTMRRMASEGFSSRQITDAVGMTFDGCRAVLKRYGITVAADASVGSTKRHDANRIVDRIVMDAENLTEGTELIDYADVNQAHVSDWVASLTESRNKLNTFIRRLAKESPHGQVA